MIITDEHAAALSKNLTDIMYSRGITQAQMANELKIPKTTVSSWMNGKRIPRSAAMEVLCRYLNCTREDLLRLPGEAPTQPAAPPQTVQKPTEGARDVDLDLVCDAIVSAGYGHLEALFRAAAGADEKSLAFVTGILQRNQK